MAYRKPTLGKTSIERNECEAGELIETVVDRLTTNGEKPPAGAGLFSELEGSPNIAHDIRADKWEIATEKMDKINTSKNSKATAKTGGKDDHKGNETPEGGDTSDIGAKNEK